MVEQKVNNNWVDRYIRDELSAEDQAVFEENLFEDSELQQELEVALAIHETLRLDEQMSGEAHVSSKSSIVTNPWTPLAMAASVLLAVVSTTLLWRSSVETGGLRQQLEALQQPRSSILNVPVNIMRSDGNDTPDVIIQKPDGKSVIVLNIELASRFQTLEMISFSLRQEGAKQFLTWSSQPSPDGHASVALNSESIPDGRVILQITGAENNVHESRLLEFRPANR